MHDIRKPLQGLRPVRGGDDNSTLSQNENYSNIPAAVIEKLENETRGINFGVVSLIVSIRDFHRTYRIEKTVSVLTGV
ncbi:MAG: hypothetical protein FWD78_00245 [Treponema sp.]|nr:hypothetical protein [Treponema sp.]